MLLLVCTRTDLALSALACMITRLAYVSHRCRWVKQRKHVTYDITADSNALFFIKK